MKINKKVKIAVLSILGVFLLLFAILVYHIANAKPIDNATIQVSRIDFKEPIDATKASEINKNMKSIDGVINPHYFPKSNAVVYLHDMKVINSKQVYDQFMKKTNLKAERYIVPENLASKEVCPVMSENSFKAKFSRQVQRIFN